ncbi:amidase family protein [Lederbergia wuyishanensis]|uniref:Amidase n=1 Tax=Lederbergia wuyishanensis TaxID=1347903 RepID=A0ABU0D7I3_9BACI|nr:amidase family protein [Lederbergia wuyishanensis]MCJ8009003.1 amidase family protein [Lederbergia wuyishanensis]MDQ0344335.1 amidase [Lederbergia wuyishanensis]
MKNPKLKQLHDEWLIEATIDEMQEKLASGEITSVDLVHMYLYRISHFDTEIRSVLEVNPDALHIATALDLERTQKGPRSGLHGIPILLKDNLDTGDKMHTTAGSLALDGHVAMKDSFVAAKLREAGAILLGKTNMTEWANFMAIGMPSGYSSRGGQTLNPYGQFDVGGSSSGSGASIAANFAAASIGTETSGSILNPSLKNSLVGIKPTVGLVSRSGVIPIAHTQDTPGPMARTVKDTAHVLTAIAGLDEKDPATLTNPSKNRIDYAAVLTETSLKGYRIGMAGKPFSDRLNKHKIKMIEEAIVCLRELGAEIIEDIVIPSAEEKWGYEVLMYEFKPDLNAYLRATSHSNEIRSLADVIAFNYKHPKAMLKYGQKVLIESEDTSGTLLEKEYIAALEKDQYLSREQGIDFALQQNNLDAIFFGGDRGSVIAAKAGYPTVIVPAGYVPNGEPFGVSFTGTAFSEETLLKIAYAFEQATKHRKPPVMKEDSHK